MGDQSWCFACDPETTQQDSEWVGETSPRPKKLKFQRSHIKTMLLIFFDSQGIVHTELVPEGKTVNAEFCKGVMDCLKHMQWARPAGFCSQDCFLLLNNVPAHKAVFDNFSPKNVTFYHLPYPPDLCPSDYFLFPKLKMKLKGFHIADVTEIQGAITDELKKVQKEEFSAALQKLYDCAKACIYANGAYFEFKKKGMCFPHVSTIFKEICLKTFGPHCVYANGAYFE